MNNQDFYNSFTFVRYSFSKTKHTDNATGQGCPRHAIGHLLRGTARLVCENRTVTLQPGEVIYIAMGCHYHSYWYPDDTGLVQWVSLSFTHFPEPNNRSYLLQKLLPGDRGLEILGKISARLERSVENIGLLYAFLANVLPQMQPGTTQADHQIQTAQAAMRKDPHARLDTIAQQCGISQSTLYNIFRSRLSITPNTMRQRILCEKAQELLVTTGLSVEEISSQLGFSSSSYFRKVLYQHTGKTPLAIRKETSL